MRRDFFIRDARDLQFTPVGQVSILELLQITQDTPMSTNLDAFLRLKRSGHHVDGETERVIEISVHLENYGQLDRLC